MTADAELAVATPAAASMAASRGHDTGEATCSASAGSGSDALTDGPAMIPPAPIRLPALPPSDAAAPAGPHPASSPTTVADVLRGAESILADWGWIQGMTFRNSDDPDESGACLDGALLLAGERDRSGEFVGRGLLHYAARRALAKYLHLRRPAHVISWNDRAGRTKDEVIAALRGAAAAEDVAAGRLAATAAEGSLGEGEPSAAAPQIGRRPPAPNG